MTLHSIRIYQHFMNTARWTSVNDAYKWIAVESGLHDTIYETKGWTLTIL